MEKNEREGLIWEEARDKGTCGGAFKIGYCICNVKKSCVVIFMTCRHRYKMVGHVS